MKQYSYRDLLGKVAEFYECADPSLKSMTAGKFLDWLRKDAEPISQDNIEGLEELPGTVWVRNNNGELVPSPHSQQLEIKAIRDLIRSHNTLAQRVQELEKENEHLNDWVQRLSDLYENLKD